MYPVAPVTSTRNCVIPTRYSSLSPPSPPSRLRSGHGHRAFECGRGLAGRVVRLAHEGRGVHPALTAVAATESREGIRVSEIGSCRIAPTRRTDVDRAA